MTTLMGDAQQLADIIQDSQTMAFLGGAGTSTESGVPDFRSESTRRRALEGFGHQPEVILSAEFFASDPATFYRYVKDVLTVPGVKPNRGHQVLAKWEKEGRLLGVATQNIDGLHQQAGSERVWELHGTLAEYHCVCCMAAYTSAQALTQLDRGLAVPHCECGGILKPDVVLYGEVLPQDAFEASMQAIAAAETLIVGGTSLAVYPAASLVRYFTGRNLVVINLEESDIDLRAHLAIHAPIAEVLAASAELL